MLRLHRSQDRSDAPNFHPFLEVATARRLRSTRLSVEQSAQCLKRSPEAKGDLRARAGEEEEVKVEQEAGAEKEETQAVEGATEEVEEELGAEKR